MSDPQFSSPQSLASRYPQYGDCVKGLVPSREVSLLSGSSGAGKTTLLMQLLAALQGGEPFLDRFEGPADLTIGIIGADRSFRTTLVLAERAGADLRRCHLRSLVDDRDIDLTALRYRSFDLLLHLIKGLIGEGVQLLMVDPLIVFFGGDTKAYFSNAAPLIALNRLCNDSGLTILGTHHATKARTDQGFKRRQDRIGGSGGALQGFSSTQLFLDTPEEADNPADGPSMLRIIHHLHPPADIPLQRTDSGLFVPATAELPPSLDATARRILEAIPPATDMRRAFLATKLPDVPQATFDRHLLQLCEAGVVVRARQGDYRRQA